MRISDWSSDVCSSDLPRTRCNAPGAKAGCVSLRQVSLHTQRKVTRAVTARKLLIFALRLSGKKKSKSSSLRSPPRSEVHTSELQSLMRTSYAVFCLKTNIQPPAHSPSDTLMPTITEHNNTSHAYFS